MSVLEAFIQGIVQGVVGLLPVPGDVHLQWIHAWGFPDRPALHDYDIDAIRLGSVLAVVVALRGEIRRLARERALWFGWLILVTVPTAVFGAQMRFMREMSQLAPWGIVMMGGFLWAVHRWGTPVSFIPGAPLPRGEINGTDALLVGFFAQVAAFCPGTGRLGLTFGSGLLCGLDRNVALLFALLVGVAGFIVDLGVGMLLWGTLPSSLGPLPLAVAGVASFSTTLVLFGPLTDALRERSIIPFIAWTLILAVAAFAFVA